MSPIWSQPQKSANSKSIFCLACNFFNIDFVYFLSMGPNLKIHSVIRPPLTKSGSIKSPATKHHEKKITKNIRPTNI